MKKFVLIVCMIFALGLVFSGFASACTEGCTPGYWKQPQHENSWMGYDPADYFNTVFGVYVFDPELTLLQALKLRGGGMNAFARHAVAALLNAACDISFGRSEQNIIDKVQLAVEYEAYEYYKDQFEEMNELGCPLD